MVLKPLSNDDIETSGSDELGFLGPFYQGAFILFPEYSIVPCLYLCVYIFFPV